MNTASLNDADRDLILGKFVEIVDWRQKSPVCVDGRHGKADPPADSEVFPQALGGSLLVGVITAMNQPSGTFEEQLIKTISALKAAGFAAGVHRSGHRTDMASDCGFADNLAVILARLHQKSAEIKKLIESVAPGVMDSDVWANLILDADRLSSGIAATGEEMVSMVAEKCTAQLQTLDGDHAEIAAIVNLASGTTLDTKSMVSAGRQAFNLDLWYVLELAKTSGLDSQYATLASLGLYLATEMVLVEDRKNIRLPIIVRS